MSKRPILPNLISAIVLPSLLAVALTAFFHGIPSGPGGNLHDGLPALFQLQDEALFPNDPFVEATRTTPTVFWHAMEARLPAEPSAAMRSGLFRWGALLSHWLFFLGAGALACVLAPERPLAWAGAILLLAGEGLTLAGANGLLSAQFSPTTLVAGPLLIAWAVAWRWRHRLWGPPLGFALAGACANFHLLNAFYAGTLLFCGLAACARSRAERWRLALAPIAGAAAAAPVLWMIATAPGTGPIPEGWADVVRSGHRIHYFLWDQPWPLLVQTIAALVLLGAWVKERWSVRPAEARFVLAVVAAVGFGFLGLGSLLADVFAWPLAIRLQPLRAASWLLPLASVALAERVFNSQENPARPLWIGAAATFFILHATRPFQAPAESFLTLHLLAMALGLLAWASKASLRAVPAALAGLGFSGAIWYLLAVVIVWVGTAAGTGIAAISQGWFFAAVVFSCAVAAGAASRRGFLSRRARPPALAWIGLLWLAVVLGSLPSRKFLDRETLLFQPPRDPALRETTAWIAENTPVDAVVQSVPRQGGLRSATRRSVYFSQDDDHALYLDPALLPLLSHRAEALGVPLAKSYAGRTWVLETVRWDVLQAEGVTHLLLPIVPGLRRHVPESYEVVFENGRYAVFARQPD
ncbi:MAG: hypothetical protein RLY93_18980 [Sumerlaeia bacterium]